MNEKFRRARFPHVVADVTERLLPVYLQSDIQALRKSRISFDRRLVSPRPIPSSYPFAMFHVKFGNRTVRHVLIEPIVFRRREKSKNTVTRWKRTVCGPPIDTVWAWNVYRTADTVAERSANRFCCCTVYICRRPYS